MKKLSIFLLCSLIFGASFAQDLARSKNAAPVQARDAEYMYSLTGNRVEWRSLDSALHAILHVANAPTGNTVVQVQGVQNRVWASFMEFYREDVRALQSGSAERVSNVLKAASPWLNTRLIADDLKITNAFQSGRQTGRDKAQGELPGLPDQ